MQAEGVPRKRMARRQLSTVPASRATARVAIGSGCSRLPGPGAPGEEGSRPAATPGTMKTQIRHGGMLTQNTPARAPAASVQAARAKLRSPARAITAAGNSTTRTSMARPMARAWRPTCGARSCQAVATRLTMRLPATMPQNMFISAAMQTAASMSRWVPGPATTTPSMSPSRTMPQLQPPMCSAVRSGVRRERRGPALIRPPR